MRSPPSYKLEPAQQHRTCKSYPCKLHPNERTSGKCPIDLRARANIGKNFHWNLHKPTRRTAQTHASSVFPGECLEITPRKNRKCLDPQPSRHAISVRYGTMIYWRMIPRHENLLLPPPIPSRDDISGHSFNGAHQ